MTVKLRINIEGIPSGNKLYETKNYHVRKEIADVWHEIVKYAVLEQLDGVFIRDFPVHVFFIVYPKNRKRDIGNTISKVLLDGIVKSGLLPNDSLTYVRGETVWFAEVDAEHPHIDVYISQAEDVLPYQIHAVASSI